VPPYVLRRMHGTCMYALVDNVDQARLCRRQSRRFTRQNQYDQEMRRTWQMGVHESEGKCGGLETFGGVRPEIAFAVRRRVAMQSSLHDHEEVQLTCIDMVVEFDELDVV
jgi:hypothetical protein